MVYLPQRLDDKCALDMDPICLYSQSIDALKMDETHFIKQFYVCTYLALVDYILNFSVNKKAVGMKESVKKPV